MDLLKSELIKLIIENKMPMIMFVQFLIHKGCSYYILPGRKSLKSFIKFVMGKQDEPKA